LLSVTALSDRSLMAGPRYLFSDDIIMRVRREFDDDADRVIAELDRMPDTRQRDRDRLPRAVLDLARCDIAAVVGLVEQALIDWRDLQTWVDDD
jgi:hypothetical protein